MYAIIETGGKQYRVSEGDTIDIEKLDAEAESQVELDKVLLIENDGEVRVGKPHIEGARVVVSVVKQGKGRKIRGLKYKAKKNYRRRYGHRQPFTRVCIEKIEA